MDSLIIAGICLGSVVLVLTVLALTMGTEWLKFTLLSSNKPAQTQAPASERPNQRDEHSALDHGATPPRGKPVTADPGWYPKTRSIETRVDKSHRSVGRSSGAPPSGSRLGLASRWASLSLIGKIAVVAAPVTALGMVLGLIGTLADSRDDEAYEAGATDAAFEARILWNAVLMDPTLWREKQSVADACRTVATTAQDGTHVLSGMDIDGIVEGCTDVLEAEQRQGRLGRLPNDAGVTSQPSTTWSPSQSRQRVPSAPTTPVTPPTGAVELPVNSYGYAAVKTQSGRMQCQIERSRVICDTGEGNWPARGVEITPDGSVRFADGNLGDIRPAAMQYRTYTVLGWTIVASSSGTRFTNERTGHGADVSVERVQSF